MKTNNTRRRGSALVATLVVVSSLALFGMALLTTTVGGARTINHQTDEFALSSTVDSVALLSMEDVWADYISGEGGAPGSIYGFRSYLDTMGVPDLGPGGPPDAEDGFDLMPEAALPTIMDEGEARAVFNGTFVDAIQLVRRDIGDSTQLYVTVSASTRRGRELTNPIINRAVQQVYTIEPEDFEGFDYAILANNVNCIFCHSQIDTVEHFYNEDPALQGTFDRAKVGTLESLMIRHNMDGNTASLNDYDCDAYVAGTVAIRGAATDHDGAPITDWNAITFKAFSFDSNGKMEEDSWGQFDVEPFVPGNTPLQPLENLYLDYPTDYASMVDGKLPTSFPAPIPDNGGFDPILGGPDPAAINNKMVDDVEFNTLADGADGAITAGVLTYVPEGAVINDAATYSAALFVGNMPSIQQNVDSNVILSGTMENPITIDGTVTIDGDMIINGFIKGEGTLIVRGNIYIPTDLEYLDGAKYLPGDPVGSPSGSTTFGISLDGTKNALGLAAGGSIMIGDYTKPASWFGPSKYAYISGDSDSYWNFTLGEISLFNRQEWTKTLAMLPAPGEISQDPATWTVANPFYEGADYIPRYYKFHDDDAIPIYNKGNLYFDPGTQTWHGDAEVAVTWDLSKLSLADPNDPNDPYLYNLANGQDATQETITPKDGWITDFMYKLSVEYFEDTRVFGQPMHLDGLVYTNNAIFTMVHRWSPMLGQMRLNGALVAADLGVLAPGYWNWGGIGTPANPPGSPFVVGLQLNYDKRVKTMLNVSNPNQVQIKRTLWNPTANIL
jgi:hypothetical protein